jgi:hypothetical protein
MTLLFSNGVVVIPISQSSIQKTGVNDSVISVAKATEPVRKDDDWR